MSSTRVVPGGLPPEQLARDRARGRHVETDELADEAEARTGLLGGDRGRRELEAAADRAGAVAHRHAFFGYGVQHRAAGRVLDPEAHESRGVAAVHSGPAVLAVADVAGGCVGAV
jgi:hypothetical protein